VNSLDDAGVKINRSIEIHIWGIGAMSQIFIDPGDALGKDIPFLGVDAWMVFLAIFKGHNGVLVFMLHEIYLVVQRVVEVLEAVATNRGHHVPVTAKVFGLAAWIGGLF
jgi:hypothetical protein